MQQSKPFERKRPAAKKLMQGGARGRRPLRKNYRLPAIWDCWGYPGPSRSGDGQIVTDPFAYATACLEWIRAQSPSDTVYARRSLSQIQTDPMARRVGKDRRVGGRGGSWIADQLMYGMMIRTTTAWDHDGNGRLEPPGRSRRYQEYGTFLKSCLLMPLLAKMGVSTLYLLPVVKVSNLFRKGELGCPYSAKDFLQFDAGQHDPLMGELPVAEEFALFVECAHRLNMRVMLDVAPRTAARDCDWILEHPDWFYWIDKRYEKGFRPPALPKIKYQNPIVGRLHEIYRSPGVREHLAKFRFAPNITAPQKWERFAAEWRERSLVRESSPARSLPRESLPATNLMAAIAKRFGVITPPGFSDVINDLQPAWSDVTYFRLFDDHGAEAAALLDDPANQPPYVLFDTIKSNLFPGERPNHELWDRIASIIPFYQQFGIDGARVDMAHALPKKLERMILDRPRRRDPDFSFIAEDLGYQHTAAHRKAGYNLVLGPGYYMEPRAAEGLMHRMVADLPKLELPIIGSAETPDSPRAAVRAGGEAFSRWAAVVNMFLPNAVPMIDSGMEVYERQPMNLGLDIGKPGRFALPKRDPQYGKLAFFDSYALHWTNRGGEEMVELIGRAANVRNKYLKYITRKSSWFAPCLGMNARRVIATGFAVPGKHRSLLMLANTSFDKPVRTSVVGLKQPREPQVLLEIAQSACPNLRDRRLTLTMPPGDVKVILV